MNMKISNCEQLLTIKDTTLKNVLIVTNNHSTFGPLDVIVMPGKGIMSGGSIFMKTLKAIYLDLNLIKFRIENFKNQTLANY